jgi:hypothetical protein
MSGKAKFFFAAGLAMACACYGQNPSTPVTVALNATLAESLTITPSVTTLTVPLAAGAMAAPSATFNVKTVWVLAANRGTVDVLGYFATPAQALSDGAGDNIPSSEVLGSVNSGTAAPFTGGADHSAGVAGGSLSLGTTAIGNTNRSSNRTDTLSLQVDLTSQPQLPAANYSGNLSLQAVAF